MEKYPRIYCATDKNVFDLLESKKKNITNNVLLELGRTRGIFYSPQSSKEGIIRHHSQLIHDHHSLQLILEHCGHGKRAEKITSKKIPQEISVETITSVVKKLSASNDENLSYRYKPIGTDRIQVVIEYNEFHYWKTQLAQIQHEEATIDIIIEDGSTTVRFPANDRANEFYSTIKEQIEELLATKFVAKEIELPESCSAEQRTRFFINLISGLDGYSLSGVYSLKIARKPPEEVTAEEDLEAEDIDSPGNRPMNIEEDEDEEDAEDKAAEFEMLSYVKSISLQGKNIQRSAEYNQLAEKGYYITKVAWRSKQLGEENLIIECDAAFQDGENGKGFKFNAKSCYKPKPLGGYSTTSRPLSEAQKLAALKAIENSAEKVVLALQQDAEVIQEAENAQDQVG